MASNLQPLQLPRSPRVSEDMTEPQLLTDLEQETIEALGNIWNNLCLIVGSGLCRENDLAELVIPIHTLQRYIMGQAAARAYPDQYRLLGKMFEGSHHV